MIHIVGLVLLRWDNALSICAAAATTGLEKVKLALGGFFQPHPGDSPRHVQLERRPKHKSFGSQNDAGDRDQRHRLALKSNWRCDEL